MKIAGIIAEYNPFHKGHALHIARTREITGCDYVVVCLSGAITQRGEFAVFSREQRALAALRCGADAVFDLPALFAVRPADAFARGGVAILDGVGCDYLSFGAETTDGRLLERLAAPDGAQTQNDIREGLERGETLVRARGEALARELGVAPQLLYAPNVMLASHYIAQIRALGSAMQPVAVPREDNYHTAAPGTLSATAVRKALRENDMDAAQAMTPPPTWDLLEQYAPMHAPDDLLLYVLRGMTAEEIAALPDVNEGLEHRVVRCAREASGFEDFITTLKCKRYTRARLTRLTAHALLGLTAEFTQAHPTPGYARLLGAREDAAPLLNELKKRAGLPIVTRVSQLGGDAVFALECRATDLRALMTAVPSQRAGGAEQRTKFLLYRTDLQKFE